MFVAMPLSGIGMPRLSIILRNRSRSSAISIESMLVPRISFWAFPHIYVRSGYILGAVAIAPLVDRRLKRHHRPPQGVTIPNANAARLAFFTQKRYFIGKEDKKMTTDVLNKEIRALPSEYISQVEKFVLYLKLKMEFGKIERDMNETLNRKESFLDALKGWRQGCSPDDDFSKDLEAGRVVEYPDASKANIWG